MAATKYIKKTVEVVTTERMWFQFDPNEDCGQWPMGVRKLDRPYGQEEKIEYVYIHNPNTLKKYGVGAPAVALIMPGQWVCDGLVADTPY